MDLEFYIVFITLNLLSSARFCLSVCSDGPYFDKIANHKLGGKAIETSFADFSDCFLHCESHSECLSLNIATSPNKEGLFECVLLRDATSVSSGVLTSSSAYHHYTRRLPNKCMPSSCHNGGTCQTIINDFKCYCPQKFTGKQCQELSCNNSSPLGMKSGALPDSSITASSQYNIHHGPARARLDIVNGGGYAGAWVAKYQDSNQWIQVDLGSVTKVMEIATQGDSHWDHWLTKYNLQHSFNGADFVNYAGGKNFTGNSDRSTKVKHTIEPAITARYIRVRPVAWYTSIAMRMELYGCK